jgi:hypothetical protein
MIAYWNLCPGQYGDRRFIRRISTNIQPVEVSTGNCLIQTYSNVPSYLLSGKLFSFHFLFFSFSFFTTSYSSFSYLFSSSFVHLLSSFSPVNLRFLSCSSFYVSPTNPNHPSSSFPFIIILFLSSLYNSPLCNLFPFNVHSLPFSSSSSFPSTPLL